jgi:cyclohexa-1,5-dienecarbonyl-CoA hydratase
LLAADFTLVAEDAMLFMTSKGEEAQDNHVSGANAARLRYVTWSAARGDITKEMERILNMLREKSAVALRFAKASTRLGQSEQTTHLEALKRINMLYLGELMGSQDADEGLRAFLEKRKPHWHNS